MHWIQVIKPFGSTVLSVLVAILPVLFIFWALAIRKMKGYMASLLTILLAILIAFTLYRMPLKLALLSGLDGALYGTFTISWIIIGAMFLYNVTVRSGQFEIIKSFMATLTGDRRLQALLIAFSFGAFLEGCAGFGTPVAITSAMLAGLGFNPLYAAGICLIANTAPVAFGSIGTPITVAAQVSGLPEMAVSQMVGRTLPLLSLLVPLYLVLVMTGIRKTLEVWPALLVSGVSFAVVQFLASNYMSQMLPDILASLVSIASLLILLRFWKPETVWHFKDEPPQTAFTLMKFSPAEVFRAWSPFILMTLMIITWGLQPVKDFLNSVGQIKVAIPGLVNSIYHPDGSILAVKPFTFNYLSNPGSAVIIATLISLPLVGMKFTTGLKVLGSTLVQLKFPIITIGSIVGFASVVNYSGMSTTMAIAMTGSGILFPFLSPILGWLGVFITGSDTSSNALFCKLQYTTAQNIHVDPVVTVAANATGGVTGKMISPQSIAVGVASVGLIGSESQLFRFTIKHSFLMLFVISVITMVQASLCKWIIPQYKTLAASAGQNPGDPLTGKIYLLIMAVIIFSIAGYIFVIHRKEHSGVSS
jgi:lactate permease